ncbi:MAG TPA: hypothetical protein VEY09_15640 [Pyrinomonadaceae bacterium]|nr:hypothetical protein [Pyrinomonadaceae bacterium]
MTRRTLALTLLFPLFVVLILLLPSPGSEAAPPPQKSQPQPQKPARPDAPGTVSGASDPGAIPDHIAYELFMRTLAEQPARAHSLAERAGFRGEQAEQLLREAEVFASTISATDGRAHDARRLSAQGLGPEASAELARLSEAKRSNVARHRENSRWTLGADGARKLSAYVGGEVKRKVKRVVVPAGAGEAGRHPSPPAGPKPGGRAGAQSFAPAASAAARQYGYAYYYGAAWDDGGTVYGVGAVTEDYYSWNTYQVTTTVGAPGWTRTATSQAGWGYAAVTNEAGLPILPDDGVFSVASSFEAQDYNFGSYYLGSTFTNQTVPPTVTLESADIEPLRVAADTTNNSDQLPTEATVTARIAATFSVPPGYRAVLQLLGTRNDNNIQYHITHDGTPFGPSNNRGQIVALAGNGNPTTATYKIRTGAGSTGGVVGNRVNLGAVAPPEGQPTPSPAPTVGARRESGELLLTFALRRPTPTPSPNPSPTPPLPTGVVCINTWGGTNTFVYSGTVSRCTSLGNDWHFDSCSCSGGCSPDAGCSPILIDVAGNGLSLTSAAEGVAFDLTGDGRTEQLGWTRAGSDDSFLFLDRDGNGEVDSGRELFGNFTDQPEPAAGEERNGFLALAVFDGGEKGGNSDGVIDASDAVYSRLRLWRDANHDGRSQAEEVVGLEEAGVWRIELRYREGRRRDGQGNEYRYRAKVEGAGQLGRWAWDVFFARGN